MTRTLEILERLIAFPTTSDSGNLDLIDWVQDLLQNAGGTVTRIASPCGDKAGLHAVIGPACTGGICLSAHTDVVPVAGQNWHREAFALSRDDTRLFGRGTTDMKGFVASALALMERAASADLSQPLSLVLSYDEEIGCVGIHQMLPALSPLIGRPRLVIVGEPTSMQVAHGHKGKVALQVRCSGEPGHSALAPQFVNAIHVAADFVNEMRDLQDALATRARDPGYDIPYSTVHIGRIEGGRALNIVPDRVTLDMEFRHLAQDPARTIRHEIDTAADRVAAAFGTRCHVEIDQVNAYPGLDVPEDHASLVLGQMLSGGTPTTKVAFGTEAGYFAQMGLDTLVIGPGDMARDGHKPDEGLDLSQLADCDAMMDRVLDQLRA